MNDQLLQRKAEALGKAVQAGDHASALNLLGEVAAEAERRGYERGRAEAQAGGQESPGRPRVSFREMQEQKREWVREREAAGDAEPEPAAEEAPPPEEGAGAGAPDAGGEAPAEEEHPKRRRKRGKAAAGEEDES